MMIVLTSGSGLSGNAAATGAFERAIGFWESIIADNITVNLTGNLGALPENVLGSANTALRTDTYTNVRNAIVSDGAGEPAQAVTTALPTAGQFNPTLPAGFTYNGNVTASKANMKALGLIGNDGTTDGSLTFSDSFNFDFDRSDGITGGYIDFESVVLHEIGHVLGFVSAVDSIKDRIATPQPVSVDALDLFRFASLPGDFTTAPRELRPGQAAVFSDGTLQYGLSTGNDHQASHWLDDGSNFSFYIGVMDPTLAAGFIAPVTSADLYAFDLVGYDLTVPEPGTWGMMVGAALLLGVMRLRRRT
jgi:hypothetical protein